MADPHGAARGRRRGPGRRVRRAARGPAQPGPGGGLPGHRAEVEPGHRSALGRAAGRRARAAVAARCRPTCATPTTRRRKSLGHGEGYDYPHDDPRGWIDQQYRPAELDGPRVLRAVAHGYEAEIAERMARPDGGRAVSASGRRSSPPTSRRRSCAAVGAVQGSGVLVAPWPSWRGSRRRRLGAARAAQPPRRSSGPASWVSCAHRRGGLGAEVDASTTCSTLSGRVAAFAAFVGAARRRRAALLRTVARAARHRSTPCARETIRRAGGALHRPRSTRALEVERVDDLLDAAESISATRRRGVTASSYLAFRRPVVSRRGRPAAPARRSCGLVGGCVEAAARWLPTGSATAWCGTTRTVGSPRARSAVGRRRRHVRAGSPTVRAAIADGRGPHRGTARPARPLRRGRRWTSR